MLNAKTALTFLKGVATKKAPMSAIDTCFTGQNGLVIKRVSHFMTSTSRVGPIIYESKRAYHKVRDVF